jgi:hypothetical protein
MRAYSETGRLFPFAPIDDEIRNAEHQIRNKFKSPKYEGSKMATDTPHKTDRDKLAGLVVFNIELGDFGK